MKYLLRVGDGLQARISFICVDVFRSFNDQAQLGREFVGRLDVALNTLF